MAVEGEIDPMHQFTVEPIAPLHIGGFAAESLVLSRTVGSQLDHPSVPVQPAKAARE